MAKNTGKVTKESAKTTIEANVKNGHAAVTISGKSEKGVRTASKDAGRTLSNTAKGNRALLKAWQRIAARNGEGY